MDYYLVVKKVTLQAQNKEFHKDNIITENDVGSDNIARYLDKGYIKHLGDKSIDALIVGNGARGASTGLPFYLTDEEFLTPEQVNNLLKKQLVEYAGRIGVAGFNPNISAADLKKLINQFIEESDENFNDYDEDENNAN